MAIDFSVRRGFNQKDGGVLSAVVTRTDGIPGFPPESIPPIPIRKRVWRTVQGVHTLRVFFAKRSVRIVSGRA
jgi:hypothetical protein